MNSIEFNDFQTLAIAVIALGLGDVIRNRIPVLKRFCIPSPVIGGMIVAAITLAIHAAKGISIEFADELKNVCMVFFFTSVGFKADIRLLKTGGRDLGLFLMVVTALILAQDTVAVLLAKLMGIGAGVGLCTGSISMVGGHGTAAAFGPILESMGVNGARTISTAAATYGLIAGSLLGGPIANQLIVKHDLLKTAQHGDPDPYVEEDTAGPDKADTRAGAIFLLAIAAGLGTLISYALSTTGVTFPQYIGAMLAAALIRNIAHVSGKYEIYTDSIDEIGNVMLALFLGMAMISLKIWDLAGLALPLVILLGAQTVLMGGFAAFVIFRVMGKDYDAAVLASGTCGFGMGATPNAMANIKTVCDRYVISVKAFLLIPIVGSMFADFINSLIITVFINVLNH